VPTHDITILRHYKELQSSTELSVPGEANRRLLAEFEILSPMFRISTHLSPSTHTLPFTASTF